MILSKSLVSHRSIDSGVGESPLVSMVRNVLTTVKIGIVNSNLMTAFTGIWLALHVTGQSVGAYAWQMVFMLSGTALLIAGSCSLNNFIDRDIDPLMERTRHRPSATGQIGAMTVLMMGIALAVGGLALLFAASPTASVLGLSGLIIYVLVYTMWMKRAYTINTIVGSFAGAIPPLIGWAAVDPTLSHPVPWILFLLMFVWQPPHFLALAVKRMGEYRRAGIPMLPVVAGFAITRRQMVAYVAVLLPVSLLLYELGPIYTGAALLLGAGWLAYAIRGLFTGDTVKWARGMFVYSLNYLLLIFAAMILATLI